MKKPSKRRAASLALYERSRRYPLPEAMNLAVTVSKKFAKFDETVDIAVRLGVNPKHSDQMVRGAVVLPAGLGKQVRVLVFAKGDKEKEAREAGADIVGAEDLIEKINGGWLEFDTAIAVPQLMGQVGKLGKVLGKRGLMPNPKTGTVTNDVAAAVRAAKAGKVEYRVDKAGIVHAPIGKMSFPVERLMENAMTLLEALQRARPSSAKGTYMQTITLSTTHGPGVRVDPSSIVFAK
ncbi:MAG: 50S ribosomal protein L1 [Myxococcales bacterium]|nr:50S ribosomal protein L1 [Myxococcales bacterium]